MKVNNSVNSCLRVIYQARRILIKVCKNLYNLCNDLGKTIHGFQTGLLTMWLGLLTLNFRSPKGSLKFFLGSSLDHIYLVTVVFFLGYTLTAVSYAFITTEEETLELTFYDQFTSVADFVFVCSLCFNPIIYAFRSTSFKEGLKPTILCCNSC